MRWGKKSVPAVDSEVVVRDQAITAGRKNYFMTGVPCFDQDQLERIRNLVENAGDMEKIYTLEGDVGEYTDIRRAKGCQLRGDDEAHGWVYDIITGVFVSANQQMHYDIVPSMSDPVQLLRYDAEDEGCFVWHSDTLPSDMTRKMTVVVPLNEPGEYEGGDLEFLQNGASVRVVQQAGVPVVFPSWLIHQVTPVTKGTRYSLVAWIRGPNWR